MAGKHDNKYDRQLCVSLLNGCGDLYVRQSAIRMSDVFGSGTRKGQSPIAEVGLGEWKPSPDCDTGFDGGDVDILRLEMAGSTPPVKSVARTPPLSAKSRVYLLGHGNWASTRLGSWDAEAVAGLLAKCNLPSGCLVSVLGCRSGGDPGVDWSTSIGSVIGLSERSIASFAGSLHFLLNDTYGIKVKLRARCALVHVTATGQKMTSRLDLTEDEFDKLEGDANFTHSTLGTKSKQAGSKYEWDWTFIGTQKISVCY